MGLDVVHLMVKGAPDYAGISNKVLRPDLYSAAMKEIGVKVAATDMAPVKLADALIKLVTGGLRAR